MDTANWYNSLIKPSFSPPAYLFGIAWSILYPIIFTSFGYTGYLIYFKKAPKYLLIPIVINLISNLSFSFIQFRLQNNFLAALDITIVFITIVWFLIKVYPYSKMVAIAQIPYLLWVAFATVLQFSITWLNR